MCLQPLCDCQRGHGYGKYEYRAAGMLDDMFTHHLRAAEPGMLEHKFTKPGIQYWNAVPTHVVI